MSTSITYQADGTATLFAVPFPYLDKLHVLVELDGVPLPVTDYVWETSSSIRTNVAYAAPSLLKIRRQTPEAALTTYQSGSTLTEEDLETDSLQALYRLEELQDETDRSLKIPYDLPGISTTLPAPAGLAPLVWNADGTAIENGSTALTGDMLLRPDLASTAAGRGAELVGFKQAGAGAVDRSVQDKGRDTISVKDFGALGDGVTGDDAAFAAADAATSGYIEVPAGTYVLSAAPALGKFWGEGVIMVGGNRAYLHPHPGPAYEIFADVFGADGSGATDASAALQRAIDYAQEADLTLTLKARASYRLDTGLTFKHGMNASDTKRYAVRLNLNTATLLPQAGVCAITVVPRCLLADSASGRGEAYIEVRNGAINGMSLAAAKAIQVGATGYITSSFSVALFENVLVAGFSGVDVSHFIEARHAHFSRWVQRGGGLTLRCMTAGAFCGDFMFEWCEFTGSLAAGRPFKIDCAAGEVRGVKLIGGAIYGSGTLLNATSTGAIGDVWFSGGVQFDGPNAPADERALEINAAGSSRIFQIHVDTAYFVAYKGQLIYATSGSTATIRQLNIAGCGIGPTETGTTGFAIHMLSVESVSVRGMEFDGVTAAMASGTKSLMNFDGCTNVVVQGNKATQCTGVGYMVVIGNGDKHIITDNMANVLTAVVNDYTSGTPTRLVADNLLVP